MAETVVIKGGKFSTTISASELTRGLRTTKRAPRNSEYLVECAGAIGREGVLSSIDQLTSIDTSAATSMFPFPQVFDFVNVTIVCDPWHIYEWEGGVLTLKYTSTLQGGIWCAIDLYDYVCLSNGAETVVRDPSDKTYSISTELPVFQAACNYNGQILIGSPDTALQPLEFWKSDDVMTVTTAFVSPYLSYMLGYLITEDELYYITDESGQKLVVEKGVNCG